MHFQGNHIINIPWLICFITLARQLLGKFSTIITRDFLELAIVVMTYTPTVTDKTSYTELVVESCNLHLSNVLFINKDEALAKFMIK